MNALLRLDEERTTFHFFKFRYTQKAKSVIHYTGITGEWRPMRLQWNQARRLPVREERFI